MNVRELTREEIGALPDQFYKDVDKLDTGIRYTPDTAIRIAGAFEGEKLVGAWALTLVPHAAPIWVAPEYRGRSRRMRRSMWTMIKQFASDIQSRYVLMTQMEGAVEVGAIIRGLKGRAVGTTFQLEV